MLNRLSPRCQSLVFICSLLLDYAGLLVLLLCSITRLAPSPEEEDYRELHGIQLADKREIVDKSSGVIRHCIPVSRCNSLYPFPFEDNRYVAFQYANYMLESAITSFGFMLEKIGVIFL